MEVDRAGVGITKTGGEWKFTEDVELVTRGDIRGGLVVRCHNDTERARVDRPEGNVLARRRSPVGDVRPREICRCERAVEDAGIGEC